MSNVYTVETIRQRVKLAVNDNPGTDSTPAWLTNVQYDTFIANGVVRGTSGSYTFRLQNTGLWVLEGDDWGGNPYAFEFASSSPFTGAGTNATYYCSCWGCITTTATDTTASYSVTGSRYDYAAIMAEVYWFLANHRAIMVAQSTGVGVGEAYKYLKDCAAEWRALRSS